MKKLLGPFKQILPMSNLPLKGPLADGDLPLLEGKHGILIDGEKIEKISLFNTLRKQSPDAEIHELSGDFIALPGLIDAHTHICFAGSRARDYAARNAGKSYLEIAKAGGGIWETVTKTRAASQQELQAGIVHRAERHLSEGVTTIEVKSGYGLSVEEELKMLRAINAVNDSHEIDLVPTCLAAHTLPRDFDGDHAAYLQEIVEKLLPQIRKEKLSNRVDIFIEESAFSVKDARSYLSKAKAMDFALTIHADQFSTGGSALAVELGAVSADHLEASGDAETSQLAQSDVITVALPGASIGLGYGYTPARNLLDDGASLAIASDWNPGSAPMGDLLLQACILGPAEKLSNAEVLAAITTRAAAALQLRDRGQLQPGMLADIIAFPCDHFNEICYHQGKLKPTKVWKKGRRLHDQN